VSAPEVPQLEELPGLAEVKAVKRADEQGFTGRKDEMVNVAELAEEGLHGGGVGEINHMARRPGRQLAEGPINAGLPIGHDSDVGA
jgi:hypothetical protein